MVYESDHPLIKNKLTLLRDKKTSHKKFRELSNEITMLLAYEALKDIETKEVDVETPIEVTKGIEIVSDLVIVPILRAGVGMLDGITSLIPTARTGFVGVYRDPETKKPIEYYCKFPEEIESPMAIVVDPMLATGGSMCATIDMLKEKGFNSIKVITIISAPEGIEEVKKYHPEVDIYTGNIDRFLNENKYIVPGLGDAGDRLFGTK
ncbi:MAG: uracil phosphoribosyltransferase [Candidatus Cloacimonadota bacterium]|nr:MAG: uracil phosphoribosyltransferase [Candidatus Cloacimonadota bacterium]PIE78682.1 MAG: uracil phosphoribosyltransferase [Candidatus Delongbacteria bacterium]